MEKKHYSVPEANLEHVKSEGLMITESWKVDPGSETGGGGDAKSTEFDYEDDFYDLWDSYNLWDDSPQY